MNEYAQTLTPDGVWILTQNNVNVIVDIIFHLRVTSLLNYFDEQQQQQYTHGISVLDAASHRDKMSNLCVYCVPMFALVAVSPRLTTALCGDRKSNIENEINK